MERCPQRERRKQLVRDLWPGRPVDHVLVLLSVADPMRELMVPLEVAV